MKKRLALLALLLLPLAGASVATYCVSQQPKTRVNVLWCGGRPSGPASEIYLVPPWDEWLERLTGGLWKAGPSHFADRTGIWLELPEDNEQPCP